MSRKEKKKINETDALYQGYSTIYQEVAVNFGLSYNAMLLFYSIANEGIVTQKDLSNRHFLPKQTVHSSIQSLMKRGFIDMKTADSNLRMKVLFLTEKGNNFANETVRPLFEAETDAASKMTVEEMETLVNITNKHLDYLQLAITKKLQK